MARIGVVALQGGYEPHLRVLRRLGHDPMEVRLATELDLVDALVLPGGESTTQLRLIYRQQMAEALNAVVRRGSPVLATCAGLILVARRVIGPQQSSLGWLDVTVERNAWGRQVDSFEASADPSSLVAARGNLASADAMPLVFIRAPRIQEVGPRVKVVATYRDEPILVRQGNVWGATFHPELTEDTRVHQAIFGSNRPPFPVRGGDHPCKPIESGPVLRISM